MITRRELRALGSEIALVGCGTTAPRRIDRAERWLSAYEQRFSRFLATSELSRLNAAAGRPYRASPSLFRLIELSLAFAERSGGLFDPTVLGPLESLGYDRSFESIGEPRGPKADRTGVSWRDVGLDPVSRTVTLPAGSGLDLGGIGKGWASDRLAAILGSPCLVDGGGDIFAGGAPPDAPSWRVGVADPFAPDQDALVLGVRNRGIATSSTLRRRWQAGGVHLHHLIDPRTRRPTTADAVQVTVVAATATLADYHAKVALLLGSAAGLAYIDREDGVEGVVFGRDGSGGESNGLAPYVLWRR
jgi:thiamine biosynthesis lipoprotein